MSLRNSRGEKTRHRHQAGTSRSKLARSLLACGVGYAVLYVIENDVIAARRCAGYSRTSQAVSELSAKGSEARPFLVATAPLSSALMSAFGFAVLKSAEGRPSLRMTGGLLVGGGVMQAMWLPLPMSPREEIVEVAGGRNDVGHLVMSAATVVLVLSQMGSGAMAFGKPFRVYSALSAAVFLGFGVLTGIESQKLARGEPTPHLGLVERLMLGAWLLWMAVSAVVLRRARAS